MGRIAVLSEELVEKISAGEVVERPASVVKELGENAVDAKARSVRIEVNGAGLISVTDDGYGMSAADAVISLRRHATSKLRDLEGLFQITTQGFRGEALSAIASVSRFTLTTAEPEAKVGTRVRAEAGTIVEVTEVGPIPGTSVEVEDLFFNVPARRKFLRRSSTELGHAQEAVIRLALAHPETGFFLQQDGRPLFSSPGNTDLRERIAAALGPEIHPHLLAVEERRLGIAITGQVASPEFTFPTARALYTFVNRRYVRDRGLNHAIQRAFRDVLAPGRQPALVLFIELDPRAVDVNVHPQKLEVRFADAASVHDSVFAAVARAIRPASAAYPSYFGSAGYASAVAQFLERAQAPWSRPEFDFKPSPEDGFFGALRAMGTLGKKYWVCEGPEASLVVLDPHAARERLRFGEIWRSVTAPEPAALQRTLFPATVELSTDQERTLVSHAQLLARLQLEVEPFGRGSVALKSLPLPMVGVDPSEVLVDLAAALQRSPGVSDEALLALGVQILACHAAKLGPPAPSLEEIETICRQLEQEDFGQACLHGGIVALEIPFFEICRR
jgi:DNA mismatch repair protein MutL